MQPEHRPRHSARKKLGIIAFTVFALLVAGGTTAFASLSNNVTLDVDGESEGVRMFGGTVGDVLESHDVKLTSADRVTPEPETPISEADRIDVRFAKNIKVANDGEESSHVVYATTIGEALEDLDIDTTDETYLSDGKNAHLPRKDYELVVSNPKKLTVSVDGRSKDVTTSAPTVSRALKDARVQIDDADEVKPGAESYLEDEQQLEVVRVDKVQRHEQVKVDAPVKVVKDDSMTKGDKKVVKKGAAGKAFQNVDVELADGKVRDRTVLNSKTFKKPQTKIVHKGTKEDSDDDSDSDDSDDSDDAEDSDDSGDDKDFGDETGDSVWDKIAQCESGGDWHINTGNGYYGGLQFSLQTWKSVGGSGRPDQASRAEQISRANTLQKKAGWGQWGCAHARFN